jgi:hypothetical protein
VTVTPLTGPSQSAPFTVTPPPPTRYGVVAGDFSPFLDGSGNPVSVQASVLNQDLQTVGQVTSANFTKDKMQIFYTQADPRGVAAYVLVGTQSPGDRLFPFTPTKPPGSDPSVVPFQKVIMGDFCLPDKPIQPVSPGRGGQCTTGLLILDTSTGLPDKKLSPLPKQIKAYVQAVDGTSKPATVSSIGPDTADISFTAPSLFKPAFLVLEVLETANGAHTFAYTPAPPVQIQDLVYTSDDLEDICKLDPTNKNKPNCIITLASDLDEPLKPVASGANATFVAAQGKVLVAHVRAPMGLEPTAILVTNKDRHTSVIVRRALKPGQNTNLLSVDMTIMDQTTADRNFGNRIAKRYLAVTLDVKNPTAQELQFNKSAIYFDVDYVEAEENPWYGFHAIVNDVSILATLGARTGSPYIAPFSKADHAPPFWSFWKKSVPARVFRFGLEQNVKQSPINYLSALGSFDETTEKMGQEFDTVQLLASIMNTIATGGIAGTSQFKSASSLLSGVFLPGLKGIVLNDSRINRRRANLVGQTLQEVIDVPPTGSASTILLLPRTGILAFTDAEIPVMIQRVIDVHLETEVVTPVAATPVEKGACKVGYTKDQARDALGEPTGVTTNADGTSTFTYPKGPVSTASFNAGGSLVSCQPRSLGDQLAEATTLVEMNATLTRLGLSLNRIRLTDGSVILADIPGVPQTFHFDDKGNKAPDYEFLFAQIKTYATKSTLEDFLIKAATALSPAQLTQIQDFIKKNPSVPTAQVLKYPSPEIANGTVVVNFKDATNIASITFEGDKPASVN